MSGRLWVLGTIVVLLYALSIAVVVNMLYTKQVPCWPDPTLKSKEICLVKQ